MAAKAGNVKGIRFDDGPSGPNQGGSAVVAFDLIGTASTGGSDTVTLGGGGQDEGSATTLTLAQIMQARRRDGKTVTITAVGGCQCAGYQGATAIYPQAGTISAGNITSITLNTAATGGASQSTTSANWDRAAHIVVTYVAV